MELPLTIKTYLIESFAEYSDREKYAFGRDLLAMFKDIRIDPFLCDKFVYIEKLTRMVAVIAVVGNEYYPCTETPANKDALRQLIERVTSNYRLVLMKKPSEITRD